MYAGVNGGERWVWRGFDTAQAGSPNHMAQAPHPNPSPWPSRQSVTYVLIASVTHVLRAYSMPCPFSLLAQVAGLESAWGAAKWVRFAKKIWRRGRTHPKPDGGKADERAWQPPWLD